MTYTKKNTKVANKSPILLLLIDQKTQKHSSVTNIEDDDGNHGDPESAGSSSRPLSTNNKLQILYYVLCALGGAVLGVLLTLLIIWCRVR